MVSKEQKSENDQKNCFINKKLNKSASITFSLFLFYHVFGIKFIVCSSRPRQIIITTSSRKTVVAWCMKKYEAMLCYVMIRCAMLCYAMLCYVMLWYVMLCYVIICYDMLCYVMWCYVMLCYSISFSVTLCCVTWYNTKSCNTNRQLHNTI